MRRTVLVVVSLVAVIVLAIVAVFAWGRLRGPDAVQTKAMALLTRDLKPKAMHNAWPALWLNRYAVPPEKINAVYAADVKRMRAWIRKREASSDVAFVSRAKEAYPEAPKLDAKQRETLCGQNGAHCLQKVREHAEAVAQALATQHARLMRFKAMSLAFPQLRHAGNRTIRLSADGTQVSAAYYYKNVSQPVLVLALRRPTPASIAHH